MNDTITLEFTNYTIKGVSFITDWYNQDGLIRMTNFTLDTLDEVNNITIDNLNDGGFGCQHIKGGVLEVYKNYQGYEVFGHSMVIGDLSDDEIEQIEDYKYDLI